MRQFAKPAYVLSFLWFLAAFLIGCSGTPQPVEVTRLVNQEVVVTVEVTREVAQAAGDVPVEVTRLVEVMVTPTLLPASEPASPTAQSDLSFTATPTPLPAGPTEQPEGNQVYIVEAGDSLSLIAGKTGVAVSEIMAANNLTSESVIIAGQPLLIPGWNGQIISGGITQNPAATASAATAPPPAASPPVGANLLPNPSFEGGWYFFNGVQEWQISEGWSLAIDEGPNTLSLEEGDVFFRPEVRVVTRDNLAPHEHDLFVFDGQKTIKVFKGGAPTHFAVFTDVALPAGAYRFTINFFPDIVSTYNGAQKVWATDPLAAEVRFIQDGGGSGWMPVAPGMKHTLTYDFTLDEPAVVRLGADFRNRFVNSNNGWFLDNWLLQAVGAP